MDIKVEVSVPVDDKRSVWLTGHAEDVEVEDVGTVTGQMAGAVAKEALELYDQAVPATQLEEEAAKIVQAAKARSDREKIPPSQRVKRPEDPETMRTFGEGKEDEHAS